MYSKHEYTKMEQFYNRARQRTESSLKYENLMTCFWCGLYFWTFCHIYF